MGVTKSNLIMYDNFHGIKSLFCPMEHKNVLNTKPVPLYCNLLANEKIVKASGQQCNLCVNVVVGWDKMVKHCLHSLLKIIHIDINSLMSMHIGQGTSSRD